MSSNPNNQEAYSIYPKLSKIDTLSQQLQDRLDLCESESIIYLTLIGKKDLSFEEISDLTNLTDKRIREHTKSLERKGLIIRASGSEERLVALHPRLALTNIFNSLQEDQNSKIRQMRRYVESLSKVLTPIYEDNRESILKTKIITSTGEPGLITTTIQLLDNSKKIHRLCISNIILNPSLVQSYEEALERGVKMQFIMPKLDRLYSEQAESLTKLVKLGLEIRIWKDTPLNFFLFDNMWVGISLKSGGGLDNTTIWTRDESLMKHFTKHFKSLWSGSYREPKIVIRYGS